jgi:hypothetical protein
MSPALMEVEELGPVRLAGVAERFARPEVAFGAVLREFESEERSIFASFAGKYVRTGALRASLTDAAASGAIRHLTPSGATFGSSIWYARFQGTSGPERHGRPSAILKVTAREAELATRTLMEFILHGGRP